MLLAIKKSASLVDNEPDKVVPQHNLNIDWEQVFRGKSNRLLLPTDVKYMVLLFYALKIDMPIIKALLSISVLLAVKVTIAKLYCYNLHKLVFENC